MIGVVNGLFAPPVMSLRPTYEDYYYAVPGSYSFAIPKGAKSIDVTVIAGGGGGQEGGATYGNIANAYPGGGGAGASGEMQHVQNVSVTPGASYAITVGAAGAAYGGAGGDSAFGELAKAAGGQSGGRGGNEPLNNTDKASGGTGGKGGIGGNGGGPGRGTYSNLLGSSGANGADTLDWGSWAVADWYVFRDPTTGKRLGQGGQGGYGYDLGSYGEQAARGLSTAQAPGTCYGGGGRGGDQKKTGTTKAPTAGQSGLVAVRVWYKAR